MEQQFGYDKSLFTNFKGNNFDCSLCLNVSRDPQECGSCGAICCQSCLRNYVEVIQMEECTMCSKKLKYLQLNETLKQEYDKLILRCPECKQEFSLGKFVQHQMICKNKLPKNQKYEQIFEEEEIVELFEECRNFNICKGRVNKKLEKQKCCSSACILQLELQSRQDVGEKLKFLKQELVQIKKQGYVVEDQFNQLEKKQKVQKKQQNKDNILENLGKSQREVKKNQSYFKWRKDYHFAQFIKFYDDDTKIFLDENDYKYRNLIADTPFNSGLHYWEIILDKQSQNESKIGVIFDPDLSNLEKAFSDYPNGYAYYGTGVLRNGSNSIGPQYGTKFKNGEVIGVFLDMTKGNLSFSVNNQYQGIAYENIPNFKKGPIYAAVSLMHHCGISYRTGLKPPSIFF